MMKSTRVFIVLFLLSLLMAGVVYGFHGSSSLPASGQYNKTVILTTGINSIDSFSAYPISSLEGIPVISINGTTISQGFAQNLSSQGVKTAIVLGGPVVISNSTIASLQAAGLNVIRIWGVTASDTALQFTQYFMPSSPLKCAVIVYYNETPATTYNYEFAASVYASRNHCLMFPSYFSEIAIPVLNYLRQNLITNTTYFGPVHLSPLATANVSGLRSVVGNASFMSRFIPSVNPVHPDRYIIVGVDSAAWNASMVLGSLPSVNSSISLVSDPQVQMPDIIAAIKSEDITDVKVIGIPSIVSQIDSILAANGITPVTYSGSGEGLMDKVLSAFKDRVHGEGAISANAHLINESFNVSAIRLLIQNLSQQVESYNVSLRSSISANTNMTLEARTALQGLIVKLTGINGLLSEASSYLANGNISGAMSLVQQARSGLNEALYFSPERSSLVASGHATFGNVSTLVNYVLSKLNNIGNVNALYAINTSTSMHFSNNYPIFSQTPSSTPVEVTGFAGFNILNPLLVNQSISFQLVNEVGYSVKLISIDGKSYGTGNGSAVVAVNESLDNASLPPKGTINVTLRSICQHPQCSAFITIIYTEPSSAFPSPMETAGMISFNPATNNGINTTTEEAVVKLYNMLMSNIHSSSSIRFTSNVNVGKELYATVNLGQFALRTYFLSSLPSSSNYTAAEIQSKYDEYPAFLSNHSNFKLFISGYILSNDSNLYTCTAAPPNLNSLTSSAPQDKAYYPTQSNCTTLVNESGLSSILPASLSHTGVINYMLLSSIVGLPLTPTETSQIPVSSVNLNYVGNRIYSGRNCSYYYITGEGSSGGIIGAYTSNYTLNICIDNALGIPIESRYSMQVNMLENGSNVMSLLYSQNSLLTGVNTSSAPVIALPAGSSFLATSQSYGLPFFLPFFPMALEGLGVFASGGSTAPSGGS